MTLLSSRRVKKGLNGRSIFLSASVPSQDRSSKYYENSHPSDIYDAVIAITKSILSSNGRIIYGGHPSISKILLSIIKDDFLFDKKSERICIYQSKFFKQIVDSTTIKLNETPYVKIKWTKNIEDSREKSLKAMRLQMLSEDEIVGAIFIGGMEGIEEEFNMFRKTLPSIKYFIIGSSGGASRILLEKMIKNNVIDKNIYSDPDLIEYLQSSKRFPLVSRKIIKEIIEEINRKLSP